MDFFFFCLNYWPQEKLNKNMNIITTKYRVKNIAIIFFHFKSRNINSNKLNQRIINIFFQILMRMMWFLKIKITRFITRKEKIFMLKNRTPISLLMFITMFKIFRSMKTRRINIICHYKITKIIQMFLKKKWIIMIAFLVKTGLS